MNPWHRIIILREGSPFILQTTIRVKKQQPIYRIPTSSTKNNTPLDILSELCGADQQSYRGESGEKVLSIKPCPGRGSQRVLGSL